MHPVRRIEARIAELRAANLWREPDHGLAGAGRSAEAQGGAPGFGEGGATGTLDTRSNDYLGLARLPVSRETLESLAGAGGGSGGSRLVSGTTEPHRALERELAAWFGQEAALYFSSAFAANSGAIAALAGPGDLILSDALNHASLVDGCRLSRARVQVLPHLDLGALEQALRQPFECCWVVTESYFGMDADVPHLRRIAELCEAHRAGLFVDEAHAIGVFGPEGRGLCAEAGVTPDVLSGGLGKAVGLQGGFVACTQQAAAWLWNRARSFVFSTAPSPLICRVAHERVLAVRGADSARGRLQALERHFDKELRQRGIGSPPGRRGPIFPVLLGGATRTLRIVGALAEEGILCQPIRPPTVPEGSSRLRINLRADMSFEDVEKLAGALQRAIAVETPGPNWSPPGIPETAAGGSGVRAELSGSDGIPAITEPTPASPGDAAASRGSITAAPAEGSELNAGALPPSVELSQHRPISGSRGAPAVAVLTPSASEEEPGPVIPPAGAKASGRLRRRGSEAEVQPEAPGAEDRRADAARTWVILGTGTGIGKTYVAEGLLRLLAAEGCAAAGLKPVETGISSDLSTIDCDAERLRRASFHVKHPTPHPLYALPDPVAPSLASRRRGQAIELKAISDWLRRTAVLGEPALGGNTPAEAPTCVIETAGGVFSPLSPSATNFDLARLAEPAHWVLVASDRLGVLHDIGACWTAMRALGRSPDSIVLSAPDTVDASTGTNASELASLGLLVPIVTLPRGDWTPLARLLAAASPPPGTLAAPGPETLAAPGPETLAAPTPPPDAPRRRR